jgi:hypothetical protein
MEDDRFNPAYNDDFDNISSGKKNELQEFKIIDKGYNKIFRMLPRSDGTLKRTKIEFYTSNGQGTNIRDAETGDYYNSKIGSLDEETFFKVNLATGECNSRNGFSTLFYRSPQHYMSHMKCSVDEKRIFQWEKRYNERNREKKNTKNVSSMSEIVVK